MSTQSYQERLALRAALTRLRRTTGLPVAFGGAAARREVRLTEFTGTLTDALRDLVVVAGSGLGGRVLATGRPGAVEDYAADHRISHEYDRPVGAEGLRALMAVPVAVCGDVRAVVYCGLRAPVRLGTQVIESAVSVANGLGVELAVQDEVERRMVQVEAAVAARAEGRRPDTHAWEDVRAAHAELRSIAQEVTDPVLRARLQSVSDRLTGPRPRAECTVVLSPREIDVLAQVAMGCTNAEAAHRLGILPETVKSYLRGAMRKLGTHTRTETVATARHAGLLP